MDTMSSSNTEASSFSGKPSYAENMMASALLKIRSDAVHRSPSREKAIAEASFVSSSPPKKKRNTKSMSSTKIPSRHSNFQSGQIPPIAQAPTGLFATNQAQGLPLTPQQLAILQGASSAGATSFPVVSSNQALQGASRQALQLALLQAGLLSTQGVQQTPVCTPLSSTSATSATWDSASARLSSNDTTTDMREEDLVSTGVTIRRDEVEAALKSKPQRGRKRENLTDTERLELTRTRNREHAKSTRIRKKQRYQELLENEKKLRDYLNKEEVNKKRRQCVVDFVSVRETMLRRLSDPSTECPESGCSSQVDNTDSKGLEDVVEDLSDFCFEDGLASLKECLAVARMHRFDETLAAKIVSRFGTAATSLLSYEIKGSSDGIGLNLNNTGFAEVKLVLNGHEKVELVTGPMVFHFGDESDKLRSVQWRVKRNAIEEELFERLDGQTSHPSVVSLDHGKTNSVKGRTDTHKASEQEKHGPGMDI